MMYTVLYESYYAAQSRWENQHSKLKKPSVSAFQKLVYLLLKLKREQRQRNNILSAFGSDEILVVIIGMQKILVTPPPSGLLVATTYSYSVFSIPHITKLVEGLKLYFSVYSIGERLMCNYVNRMWLLNINSSLC